MMHKAKCSIEEVPIVFQGHSSNFKITRIKKSSILTQIEHFRTTTPIWIHQWLWNDEQSLKEHGRGALLLFKAIRQISRSHLTKNCWFLPKLSVSRTVTQVWLHRWLWNDAQSLMWYRIGALSFSKVIHQISRSLRIKYLEFRPELSASGL